MKYLKYLVSMVLSLCLMFLVGCVSTSTKYGVESPTNFTETYLLEDMDLFSIINPKSNNAARNWYFNSYASVIPNVKISSGYYSSKGELLAAHLFEGEDTSKGTVIMIHGYNGHPLETHFQYFAQQFILRGYRAILLDLPGHGFSGGRRGVIDDYSKYAAMVNNFLIFTKDTLGPQVIMIGHSVGADAIYDAYVNYPDTMKFVTKSVLIAPFIDLNHSGLYSFGSFFVRDIKNENTNPMRLANFPLSWIRTQSKWTKALEDYNTVHERMLIVFGDNDKVIKYKNSVVYFTKNTSNSDIKIYKGQNHTFSNEGYKDFRQETLDWILQEINYSSN